MVVGYLPPMEGQEYDEGPVTSQISYCPFCGQKLETWFDEMLAEEQEVMHKD